VVGDIHSYGGLKSFIWSPLLRRPRPGMTLNRFVTIFIASLTRVVRVAPEMYFNLINERTASQWPNS
jgi:hypothetical protein